MWFCRTGDRVNSRASRRLTVKRTLSTAATVSSIKSLLVDFSRMWFARLASKSINKLPLCHLILIFIFFFYFFIVAFLQPWILFGTFLWIWAHRLVQRLVPPLIINSRMTSRRPLLTVWNGSLELNISALRPRSNVHVVSVIRNRPSSWRWRNCPLLPVSISRHLLIFFINFKISSFKIWISFFVAFRTFQPIPQKDLIIYRLSWISGHEPIHVA